MAAARISAGTALVSPVVPRFIPAAPEDFGLQDNLLVFDVEEVFRLAYRVGSFRLAWSVSGQVEDENAGTRTVYSGSGQAVSRRYFVRAIGEGLEFFTRVQGFFADFGQNQFNTYADGVRKTLSALGSPGLANLSLPFQKDNGLQVAIYDLATNDLLGDSEQDASYLFTGATASLPGGSGAFLAKFWPEVIFPLVPAGTEISAQPGGLITQRRTGQFLGRAFDFYTHPDVTVSLTVTAGAEMPL